MRRVVGPFRHPVSALSIALAASAAGLPVAAQTGGLTEEMNRGLQMSPINQIALPHYALAEHCGATEEQLAAIKIRYRKGEPGLPNHMPAAIFDEFFDRNLPQARTNLAAKMDGHSPSEKKAACQQLKLPQV